MKPLFSHSTSNRSRLDGIPLRPAVVRPRATEFRPDRANVAADEALLSRVRREFDEMPGLTLTLGQASRLFGLQPDVCSQILERLIREGVLRLRPGSQYGRAGTEHSPAPPSSTATPEPVCGLEPDLDLLQVAACNVLLVGPPTKTSKLLAAMRPALRQPVVDAVDNVVEVASLPQEGTVILRNVESLDDRQRRGLSAWMGSSAARVVTICEAPLYARVIDGVFPADLYYRLNTVTLIETPDDVMSFKEPGGDGAQC
jgi:hypothetical protein